MRIEDLFFCKLPQPVDNIEIGRVLGKEKKVDA